MYGLVSFFCVRKFNWDDRKDGKEGRKGIKKGVAICQLYYCVFCVCIPPGYLRILDPTILSLSLHVLSPVRSPHMPYYVDTSLNRGLATSHGPCISLHISTFPEG